jgi:acyl carrier protein
MGIEVTLADFVSEELLDRQQAVQPEDKLLTEGLVDSLGMMRLVAFIDESFQFNVPAEDVVLEHFGTVNRIAAYLRGQGVSD